MKKSDQTGDIKNLQKILANTPPSHILIAFDDKPAKTLEEHAAQQKKTQKRTTHKKELER